MVLSLIWEGNDDEDDDDDDYGWMQKKLVFI